MAVRARKRTRRLLSLLAVTRLREGPINDEAQTDGGFGPASPPFTWRLPLAGLLDAKTSLSHS